MAPYHSYLETLLKTRKYREEIAYRELSEQLSLLKIETEHLKKLIGTSDDALDRLMQYQKRGGDPIEIQKHYGFIQHQGIKIKSQEEKISLQDKAVEIKRQELEEIVQERKIVEKVETRRKEAYLESVRKKEVAMLDEVAGRMQRKLK